MLSVPGRCGTEIVTAPAWVPPAPGAEESVPVTVACSLGGPIRRQAQKHPLSVAAPLWVPSEPLGGTVVLLGVPFTVIQTAPCPLSLPEEVQHGVPTGVPARCPRGREFSYQSSAEHCVAMASARFSRLLAACAQHRSLFHRRDQPAAVAKGRAQPTHPSKYLLPVSSE